MGYRSDVRIMTSPEGFEKMQEITWKLKEEKGLQDDMVLLPQPGEDPAKFFNYYDTQKDYLCFGFGSVKWHEHYKDVSLFMETLRVANEIGVEWQFIRIGEECSDIEELTSDNFYDDPVMVMNITVDVTY